jgi:hypothetical protein
MTGKQHNGWKSDKHRLIFIKKIEEQMKEYHSNLKGCCRTHIYQYEQTGRYNNLWTCSDCGKWYQRLGQGRFKKIEGVKISDNDDRIQGIMKDGCLTIYY